LPGVFDRDTPRQKTCGSNNYRFLLSSHASWKNEILGLMYETQNLNWKNLDLKIGNLVQKKTGDKSSL
jgi:hypothetical protein